MGRGLPAAVAQQCIRAADGVGDEPLDGVQLAATCLTVRVRRGGRRLRVARGVGAGDDGAAPTLGVEGDGGVEGEGRQAEKGAHLVRVRVSVSVRVRVRVRVRVSVRVRVRVRVRLGLGLGLGFAEEGAHALHGGGCRAEEVVGELEQQVLAWWG